MPFFKIRRPFRSWTSKTGIFQQRDYPLRKNSNFSTTGKGTSLLVPLSPWKMCPRFGAGGVLSAPQVLFPQLLHRVLKNSILTLILGGAAVHRCDKRPVFRAGFSRCGRTPNSPKEPS